MVGLANGVLWSTTPWLVAKLFGLTHYGSNVGAVILTSAAMTLLFSFLVEPNVYQAHIGVAKSECGGTEDDSDTCFGASCFFITHLVVAASAVAAAGLSLALLSRDPAATRV